MERQCLPCILSSHSKDQTACNYESVGIGACQLLSMLKYYSYLQIFPIIKSLHFCSKHGYEPLSHVTQQSETMSLPTPVWYSHHLLSPSILLGEKGWFTLLVDWDGDNNVSSSLVSPRKQKPRHTQPTNT